MRILTVGENDSGQRLDRFLTKAVKNMPQSLMYKSVRTKKIKVNRSRAQIGQILKTGDTVQLFLPDDVFGDGNEKNMTEAVLSHTAPVFDVVYEDKNILVVFKPAGLSAHADETNDTNNLLTQIQAYLYKKGEYSPLAEQSFSPALCHRIDRNTEGLVMAAKNAAALREADRLIRERLVRKKYVALVHGTPPEAEGVLTAYLRKNQAENKAEVRRGPFPGAKEIKTGYRVIGKYGNFNAVEVELLTGRTHQIRAHFAFIGCPLVGDGKYGINRDDRKKGFAHQALCAVSLTFSDCREPLEYLNGKTITVPKEKISFLKSPIPYEK